MPSVWPCIIFKHLLLLNVKEILVSILNREEHLSIKLHQDSSLRDITSSIFLVPILDKTRILVVKMKYRPVEDYHE